MQLKFNLLRMTKTNLLHMTCKFVMHDSKLSKSKTDFDNLSIIDKVPETRDFFSQ